MGVWCALGFDARILWRAVVFNELNEILTPGKAVLKNELEHGSVWPHDWGRSKGAVVSQPEQEEVERLTSPDPFDLVRKIGKSLSCVSDSESPRTVKYLWLYVSKHGMGCPDETGNVPPTLEQWLNVVDEAATLGAERMVLSAQVDLAEFPDVWEIVRWAQDAHGMIVGIHIFSNEVSDEMLAQMKLLDLERLRLFVSESTVESLVRLEQEGIRVRVAQPASDHPSQPCDMPQTMLFVNPRGQIYTCGMVEGKRNFWLGTIFEGFFSKMVADPDLPRSVPVESQDVERGCEGCPPLLARYFYGD